MGFCTKCGSQLKETAKFCVNCGAAVIDGAQEIQKTETIMPVQVGQLGGVPNPAAEKSGSRKGSPGLIAGIAIAVVVIGLLVYGYIGGWFTINIGKTDPAIDAAPSQPVSSAQETHTTDANQPGENTASRGDTQPGLAMDDPQTPDPPPEANQAIPVPPRVPSQNL